MTRYRQYARRAAGIATIVALGWLGLLLSNSLDWVGQTFPGFFLLRNGVVASITLPDWPNAEPLFQKEVVSVQGVAIDTSAAFYEEVRRYPAGTAITYAARGPDGAVEKHTVSSREFSGADFTFLFGSYLVSGGAFLLVALIVFWLRPLQPDSTGLLSTGLSAGIFALTATELYWPYTLFRLHIVGECLLPASFIHLAMVFPRDRFPRHRRLLLSMLYGPFVCLLAVYQIVLNDPTAYVFVHSIAVAGAGLSGVVILLAISYEIVNTRSSMMRRRVAIVMIGAACGFVMPTFLWLASGILGGTIPVNAAGLTAFLFPMSLGYAIVKTDLFEIDVFLRRALAYFTVVGVVALAYFGFLFGIEVVTPKHGNSDWSPILFALLNLLLLFLLAPLRARIQQAIDRIFFRLNYVPSEKLTELSHRLAAPSTVREVARQAEALCAETVCPRESRFLVRRESTFTSVPESGKEAQTVPVASEILVLLEAGEVIARHNLDRMFATQELDLLNRLEAEIIVPLGTRDSFLGLLALGPRMAGTIYGSEDVAFLKSAASQIALGLTTAFAFGRLDDLNRSLEQLNESLEQQVKVRTAELDQKNAQLNQSLANLTDAYGKLEQSQSSLLRADRLATLGRLTAGIAHEMNTPLSAVLNAMKILRELANEYRESIGDPRVLPSDHRAIADEMSTTAEMAGKWAEKAAGYIRSVKTHGREQRRGAVGEFTVRSIVEESSFLLAHRLRRASCSIDYSEEPAGTVLHGDPGPFNQILVNLITNSIDAYEDRGIEVGRIEVRCEATDDFVRVSVQDYAGGIPEDVIPRVFEELYTTKGPGRGTGLGLWIARNLVEQQFHGDLKAQSDSETGSVFVAVFPKRLGDHANTPPEEPAVVQPLPPPASY